MNQKLSTPLEPESLLMKKVNFFDIGSQMGG
jgi:hypothetical protein